ncbi:DnaJ family domain-containing protein [Neobacillus sp. SM06]|uniref:DnaJ family domain-containing protein n=1 Tax=Neobacillus sp. SM06 TaxID=3422492 RepID=UPI003D2BDE7A
MRQGGIKIEFFQIVSEDRIKKAYNDGEFDRLPGFGKPLELEDLSSIPEELRIAYKLLKNAGFTDEENRLRQEMLSIEDLIKKVENNDEKEKLQKQLNEKLLRYNRLMSNRRVKTNSAGFKNYQQKIHEKLKID